MAQRAAFARAKRFLWYRPTPAAISLLLAPWSGLLLVFILTRVGLLVDLAMTRSVVPNVAAVAAWAQKHEASVDGSLLVRMAQEREGLGIFALAVRTQDDWYGRFFAGLAISFPQLVNNYYYLLFLVIGLLVSALLFSLVSFLQKRTAAAAAIDATIRLRRSVHTHAYRIGAFSLRTIGNGQVGGASMRALDTVQEGLYGWFVRTIHEPCNLAWLTGFLILLDSVHGVPWTALMILTAVLLYWLISSLIMSWTRRRERLDMLKTAEGQSLLQESLGMHRLVKTYSMEAFNKNRLERFLHRQARSVQSRWYWSFLSRHGRWTLIAILGPLLALALVGNILSRDLRFLPVMMILMTVGCIFIVLHRWQLAWRQVRKGEVAAQSLFALLDRQTDVKQVVGAEYLPALANKLELVNVTVPQPGSQGTLLDTMTLTVAAGEHVALVGDEQARVTVAHLLPRLIDPEGGEVRIDGKPLTWATLESVRRQVAVVLQDDLIFNDSVMNNIGCGDEKYALPQIIEAAKVAHAHNFIMKLASGYETPIGELGEPLTVGQQFRIGLARAILRDPTLIVIQEPNQGLGEEEKAWLDDTMSRFLRGRTAILLPSRLSTIRKADRVIMLHEGKVVDQGTDQELINRCERYKHWQYLQYHEFQGQE